MLPDAWEELTLGAVTRIATGGTPSRDVPEYWNGDIPWMSSGEINQRIVCSVAERITASGMENSSAKLLYPDTIMIALNGQGKTRGKVALLKIETTCNQSLAGIVPNLDKANPEYLFHYLESRYQEIRHITGDDARNGLNLAILKSIPIVLPPLDEQRRIAEVLRSVDETIRLAEQSARSTRAAFNHLIDDLHRLYEDSSVPLADFCVPKGLQTGPFGSQLKVADYVDAGIPVIMPSDLRPDGIDFSGAKSTSPLKARQLPQHHLQPGDIIFSRRGDVEKCGLYLAGDPPALCGTGCLRARIDVTKADPVLIYFLAQSDRCGSWLTQHAVGLTMPNLNTSIVGKLPIPNLPLVEQKRWVEVLLLAEGACRVNETYLAEAKSLKLALSSDLLSGRVRVPA